MTRSESNSESVPEFSRNNGKIRILDFEIFVFSRVLEMLVFIRSDPKLFINPTTNFLDFYTFMHSNSHKNKFLSTLYCFKDSFFLFFDRVSQSMFD